MQAKPDHPEADGPEADVLTPPFCSIFRRFLKGKGLKFTAERAMILDTVSNTDGIFEVDQLVVGMQQRGYNVSRATAYRTMKHLVEAGIIQQVLLDAKLSHYQLIHGRRQRDHLINVQNDQVTEFYSQQVKELCEQIAHEHGYEAVDHQLLIYGISAKGSGKTTRRGGDGQ